LSPAPCGLAIVANDELVGIGPADDQAVPVATARRRRRRGRAPPALAASSAGGRSLSMAPATRAASPAATGRNRPFNFVKERILGLGEVVDIWVVPRRFTAGCVHGPHTYQVADTGFCLWRGSDPCEPCYGCGRLGAGNETVRPTSSRSGRPEGEDAMLHRWIEDALRLSSTMAVCDGRVYQRHARDLMVRTRT
jgi:hypothetical protein